MSIQDLFGLKSDDLGSARAAVEGALGLALEPRRSSYRGGEYYHKEFENKDQIILQRNDDGEEGGHAEEDYQDFGILLYVYSVDDGFGPGKLALQRASDFTLLERSIITPSRLLRRMRYTNGSEEIYFEKQLDPA